MIRRYPAADPEDVAVAQKLLDEAREPIHDQITELTWPWDTVSASVSTILTECLGPELAGPALEPFSSRLALFPARGGDIIGDALLSPLCRAEQEEAPRERSSVDPGRSRKPPSPQWPGGRGAAAPEPGVCPGNLPRSQGPEPGSARLPQL